MKPTVFIQTNERQEIGARVAAHSLKRASARPDAFDVRIMRTAEFPWLAAREGQPFLRGGGSRVWTMQDLQSFTPLRFMPPKLMGYEGVALVIDPDVFAVADVMELLDRDRQGKSVLCRFRPGDGGRRPYYASSVMLLDCARLRHWDAERQFDELFRRERDYLDWVQLKLEPEESIGQLEDEWNDFDRLTERTRLLHNTKRKTQPWKTGLPVDFTPAQHVSEGLGQRLRSFGRRMLGRGAGTDFYRAHPDPRQEALFFRLLGECLDNGAIPEAMLRDAMAADYIRHDAFEVLSRARAA